MNPSWSQRRFRVPGSRRSTLLSVGLVIGLVVGVAVGAERTPTSVEAAQPAGSTYELQVTGRAGVPANASAAVLNLTAVNPTGHGFITAYPCGKARPNASTLNYQPGDPATANLAIVDIGTGGKICLYTLQPVDILADINGWFPAGADYTPRNPNRLLDTRNITTPPPTNPPTTPPTTPPTPTPPPANAAFVETFDGNTGLDRFRYGVYHRGVGWQQAGRAPVLVGNNNVGAAGQWSADHDLSCGSPDTQRPLRTDFFQDKTGENGWKPRVDFHLDELLYLCRDHLMTSMGDVAAYSIVWFSPDQVFSSVSKVCVDVNLTDLGTRQWWKIGVVSDGLYNSKINGNPGLLISDVGTSDLPGSLSGPDRLLASWSGAASAGYPGALKIGGTKVGAGFNGGDDKKTRHPACLTDNGNGTVTFSVAGVSKTTSGSFPAEPSRVVFYDHNYNPDKDTNPIGHTWHWDNIVVWE